MSAYLRANIFKHLCPEFGYATLHDGDWSRNEDGTLVDNENIPEIARTRATTDGTRFVFENLPECDCSHIAVWTDSGRILLRAHIFKVKDFPEWAESRHVPEGATVTVYFDSLTQGRVP